MATRRFGKYSLPNAGTCNYGNSGDLPEIHQGKTVGTLTGLIRFSAIWVGRWERKPLCPRGNLFSNSTVHDGPQQAILWAKEHRVILRISLAK